MRTVALVLAQKVCVAVILILGSIHPAASQGVPRKDLGALYKLDPEWGRRLPDGRKWGASSSTHTTSDGHVWALDRCGGMSCAGSKLDPVLLFDSSGRVVKQIGAGLFSTPHGLTIDKEGNVWATDYTTDKASGKGAQVFKWSPAGKLLLSLGKPGVSLEGRDTFVAPADVLIGPDGSIFVSDGHYNCKCTTGRIVKFAPDGKYIKEFGKFGTAPGELDDPHSLAMDSKGRLFVADRQNNRIQVFDQEGKLLAVWEQYGRPSGIWIDKNDNLYSASQSPAPRNTFEVNAAHTIWVGNAATGEITGYIPTPPIGDHPEGLSIDDAGNIYAAEAVGGPGLRKYVKQ